MHYRDKSLFFLALSCLFSTVHAQPQPENTEPHTAELSPIVVVASKQNTPGVEVINPQNSPSAFTRTRTVLIYLNQLQE